MIVRELITRLGFSLNQSQLNNAERATERVKDRAEQAAKAFRNIVVSIASIATIKTLVGIADEMQNARIRIEALPQTIGDAGAAMDELIKHANDSGMAIEAYSRLYTRVGFAAKDYITTQEDLLGITDTISKALAVGGASSQEAAAVLTQFSQALASGVLQGDEFRSMAEAAPQYLDKLSEAMGIPRENLKKMASEGKLTAKAVIEATRTMGGYFEDRFNKMPMTVGRAMTVVSNRFARMMDKMNRDSGIIPRLASVILTMFDKIEMGVDKLVEVFGGWGNLLRFLGFALGAAFGAKAISILLAFRAVSWTVMLPFIKIIAIIAAVALVLEDLYMWINGGDSLVGSLIGPWEEWEPVVMGAVHAVGAVFEWLGTLIAAVAAVLVGLFTLDPNLIIEGLKGIGGQIWQIVGQWGQWIYDGIFAPIINAVSDAWNAVMGKIGGAWDAAKNFVGMGPQGAGTGGAMGEASTVTPAQLTGPAMGQGRPNINNQTQVNVTVPPGTTAEQAAFLQNAAQKSFNKATDDKLARDLAVYAP